MDDAENLAALDQTAPHKAGSSLVRPLLARAELCGQVVPIGPLITPKMLKRSTLSRSEVE